MGCQMPLLLCTALFVLLGCGIVSGEYHVDYEVQIGLDGTAEWTIEERFLTGENPPPSPQLFEAFISNLTVLVDSAKAKIGREMAIDGFAMTANVSGSYTFARYRFHWAGFAAVENDTVRIGDVFEVEGLFLYGEGSVTIRYPPGYVVESVSPPPHGQSPQTMTWWGIGDFNLGEPSIVLTKKGAATVLDMVKDNSIIVIIGLITITGLSATSLYYFKLKKTANREKLSTGQPVIPEGSVIEDDEEKIVRILKAAGGHLNQSAIASQCRFSKAKASILLTEMEKKGTVRRRERGREKIVTLARKSGEGEGQI
jgi:hypothetical protein